MQYYFDYSVDKVPNLTNKYNITFDTGGGDLSGYRNVRVPKGRLFVIAFDMDSKQISIY